MKLEGEKDRTGWGGRGSGRRKEEGEGKRREKGGRGQCRDGGRKEGQGGEDWES